MASMANNDLLKWVNSDVDFYELLGIAFENCSESELRRAYRKTALKYHPDKVGKDFDPDKYELFQAANDILSDPELKAKYDGHRQAKIQRQRANDLFDSKRRQMREDLEARERGGETSTGIKRSRENDEILSKLAEEGRKRRAARASMMAENFKAETTSSPAPPSRKEPAKEAAKEAPSTNVEQPEEDEVERLERRLREAEQAKAKRKAEKKARKSGVFVPADSPSVAEAGPKLANQDTATPIKRSDIFKGLKADEKSSASPKFSFSPSIPTPKKNDFAATMARLRAAEKERMKDEILQKEAAEAAQ
jgi:DnaJ family protein C protein 17